MKIDDKVVSNEHGTFRISDYVRIRKDNTKGMSWYDDNIRRIVGFLKLNSGYGATLDNILNNDYGYEINICYLEKDLKSIRKDKLKKIL